MLEESNSEVTSSSALIMSPSIALSPNSLGSPEYSELDLWGYDDNPLHSSHGHGGGGGVGINGHHHPNSGVVGGGALGATNLNGMHNHHHGNSGAALQSSNNHHIHGALMNGVGTAHINRLTQGMVNELLAANAGNGLGLGVDLMGGTGTVLTNSNMTSSRSSTSPSIGKLIQI